MGFKNKSVGFRVVEVVSKDWKPEQAKLPEIGKLNERTAFSGQPSAGSYQRSAAEVVQGWAGWRHAQQDATAPAARLEDQGIVFLQALQVSKKVPPSLLKTKIAAALETREKVTGQRVSRKEAAELRKNVALALRDEAQISYRGDELAWAREEVNAKAQSEAEVVKLGVTTAVSDNASDGLMMLAKYTLGLELRPVTAARILDGGALGEHALPVGVTRDWHPLDFGGDGDLVADDWARDFLLWIMWRGSVQLSAVRSQPAVIGVGYEIGGMVLVKPTESGKTKAVTFKAGRMYKFTELSAKVRDGYKPSKVKLMVSGYGSTAQLVFEPETWTLRSVKIVADGDAAGIMKAEEMIAWRVAECIKLHGALVDLLLCYAAQRSDPKKWAAVEQGMREWIGLVEKPETGNVKPETVEKREEATHPASLGLRRTSRREVKAKGAEQPKDDFDELVVRAAAVIRQTGVATPVGIRGKLKTSLVNAVAVLDELEEAGVVGREMRSKPREIHIGKLKAFLAEHGHPKQPDKGTKK